MREVLLERQDEFRRNLAIRLLAFALGRELQFFDDPVIEGIAGRVAGDIQQRHARYDSDDEKHDDDLE